MRGSLSLSLSADLHVCNVYRVDGAMCGIVIDADDAVTQQNSQGVPFDHEAYGHWWIAIALNIQRTRSQPNKFE